MNVRLVRVGVLLAALLAIACQAEEIEIAAESANIKVADQVVATVSKGDRLLVRQRRGPWIAVRVKTDAGPRDGWILATQTRPVLAEGVTPDSPAPATPQFIELDVQLTQVTSSFKPHLFCKVSLANNDTKAAEYRREDFALELDGNAIKPVEASTQRSYYGSVYTNASMSSSSELTMLKQGQLAPGDRAGGWLQFELPRMRQAREMAEKKWILTAKVGDQTIKLDLKKTEQEALGARLRKAQLDDSVQIISVGKRVNGLNVTKLVEMMTPMIQSKEGVILTLQQNECLVDYAASRELQTALRSDRSGLVAVGIPSRVRSRFGYPSRTANTEAEGVMLVLGGRDDAGPRLLKHLGSSDMAIRIAAAGALRNAKYDEDVAAALIQCVSDENAKLQAAAARALHSRAGNPTVLVTLLDASKSDNVALRQAALESLGNAKDTLATEVIVQAMSDPNSSIQVAAAQAASHCPQEHVVEPLIKLLDGPQTVASAVCGILAQFKAQAAVPKLRELHTGRNPYLRTTAAAALLTLGAITPVEAAATRLESGSSSTSDIELLKKGDPATVVPKLIAMLRSNNTYMVDQFAKALGETGDRSAVQPLINVLNYRSSASTEIPRALGLLGDQRAVKPLQQALRSNVYHSQSGTIYEALMALKAPGITEQIAEEIRKDPNASKTRSLLDALGNGGPESAAVIEPFLDHASHNAVAATSLARIATPKALAEVRKRLLSKDYKYGANLLSALRQKPTPAGIELIAAAQDSANDETRKAAASQLVSAQQTLSRQRLSLFEAQVKMMEFAAADQTFLEFLKEDLARALKSPAMAASLPNHFSTAYSAYQNIGKPQQAAALLEEAMLVVDVQLRPKDTQASRSLLRAMRGRQLQMLVSSGNLPQAENSFAAELNVARTAQRDNPDDIKASRRVRDLLSIQDKIYSRDPVKAEGMRAVFVDFHGQHIKKHGLAEPGWTLARTSFCPDAVSARYNPKDKLVYYLRRTRAQLKGGLYRIERAGSKQLGVVDRPAALAVNAQSGDVLVTEDNSGRLLLLPLGGQQAEPWISTLQDSGNPVGIAVAPPQYAGPLLQPGEALVVDRGYRGESGLWKIPAAGKPGAAATSVLKGEGIFTEPTDVAFGKSAIYIVDSGKQQVFTVASDGKPKPLATQQPIGKPVGVAVDPRDESLLVLDAEGARVVRVDPSSGAVRNVVTDLLGPQWSGVAVSPDGGSLYVTDTAAGAVLTLTR